jgi:hypothetical protein
MTPLSLTSPTLCPVAYGWHLSSSTHTASAPQATSQNGARGFSRRQGPSSSTTLQTMVDGVGASFTLPMTLVEPVVGSSSSATTCT